MNNEYRTIGAITSIILCNRYGEYIAETFIDTKNLEKVSAYNWRYKEGYAGATLKSGQTLLMHHLILGKPPKGFETDHENKDKLDNCENNLRFYTRSQNRFNTDPPVTNTSGHKGVGWYKKKRKWRAYIRVNDKLYHLGLFKTLEKAVIARKEAEKQLCI